MKIDANKVPAEGLTLVEEFNPKALELDTELIKFRTPLKAKAFLFRITNAVTVKLELSAAVASVCSRCLKESVSDFTKCAQLNFSVDKSDSMLDLDPEIREEVILDYPINPLCRPDCPGLCPKCGKDLNEGQCSCIKGSI